MCVPRRVYRSYSPELLTDEFVSTIASPPRRYERRSDYGLELESAVDIYMDTKLRGLGLWVLDTGFKYFAIKPRRLPAGVSKVQRKYVEENGIMIGPPCWVSLRRHTVLTVAQARVEALGLLQLLPAVEVWPDGTLDPDGVLVLDYNPPRGARARPRPRTLRP